DAEGYDATLTGFDAQELEDLLTWTPDGGMAEEPEERDDDAPTVTQSGDVWCMGPHRLMCGDSTDPVQVARLWGRTQPTVMILDPPFDMEYDAWEPADHVRLLMVWARGHTGLRWVGARVGDPPLWGVSTLAFSGQARGWARPEWPSLVHEVVYVLRRGEDKGGRCRPEPALAYGLRVTEDNRPFSFYEGLASRRNDMSWAKNPACFAVFLCMTRKGEVVYDPCAGSGASLLACERAKNPWLGMEMQPKWADMVVRRWQEDTGKAAKLEGSAATFAQVEAERVEQYV